MIDSLLGVYQGVCTNLQGCSRGAMQHARAQGLPDTRDEGQDQASDLGSGSSGRPGLEPGSPRAGAGGSACARAVPPGRQAGQCVGGWRRRRAARVPAGPGVRPRVCARWSPRPLHWRARLASLFPLLRSYEGCLMSKTHILCHHTGLCRWHDRLTLVLCCACHTWSEGVASLEAKTSNPKRP